MQSIWRLWLMEWVCSTPVLAPMLIWGGENMSLKLNVSLVLINLI